MLTRRTTTRAAALLGSLALLTAACADDGDPEVDPTDETAAVDDDAGEDYDVANQPEDAQATIVSPADGDTVTSPVTFELDADGVDIVPADAPAVGEAHLHVIVDSGCVDAGEIIPGPSDEATEDGYNHLGDGSMETEVELEPGEHEVCAQLADGIHQAFGQTDTITVTIE